MLINCVKVENRTNLSIIEKIIYVTLENINIYFSNLRMIISDAARYMKKVIKEIERSQPNIFHELCLAHLMHNWALKMKTYYKRVHFFIASIKSITIKIKHFQAFLINFVFHQMLLLQDGQVG